MEIRPSRKYYKLLKRQSKDDQLKIIFNYLKTNNLTISRKNYIDFYNYINDDDQITVCKKYLDVLIGEFDCKYSIELLNQIIIDYNKYRKIYTFKRLYEIDREWYNYYKENTDSEGIRNIKEKRFGVNKEYVDDVMIIKNMSIVKCNLEMAMIVYENIRIKSIDFI